jgi:hypothetical protein
VLAVVAGAAVVSHGRRGPALERWREFEPIKGLRSKDRIILPENISANPCSVQAWVGKTVADARS